MLLNELTGYKSAQDMELADVLSNLIKSGKYKKYNGEYAFVLEPPGKNYVYRLWTDDRGYWDFLEYIGDNPSEHVIKLIGAVRKVPMFFKHPSNHEYFYAARLEKLKPITSSTAIEVISACNDEIKRLKPAKLKILTFGDLLHNAMQRTYDHEEIIEEFMQAHKSFFDEYIKIAQWVSQHGASFIDMHAKNIMMRGNQFVITDPFHFSDLNVVSMVDLEKGISTSRHPLTSIRPPLDRG